MFFHIVTVKVQNWNCRPHVLQIFHQIVSVCDMLAISVTFFGFYAVACVRGHQTGMLETSPHKWWRFCAKPLCQCERIGGQIGPMLRRSSRVKLLPHLDFLGRCIDSKCAKMGAKSLSNPEIEACVSATQGSSFCSFVVLHHFVEKVHDNQVIQAVAFFLSPSVGLVT